MRLFQTLDDFEKNCLLYYSEEEFTEKYNSDFTHTWNYRPYLQNKKIEYAKLYVQGKTLDEVCPLHLKEAWTLISKKMSAHIKSIKTVGVDLSRTCYLDLIPISFIKKYLFYKNEITRIVIRDVERPENYDFLLSLERLLSDVAEKKLNTTLHKDRRIVYNAHKSVTGRLTVEGASFPILNLKTELRKEIKPNNDLFLELDYNAADLRTFLALSEHEQPSEDIHSWNDQNIFGKIGRQEAKRSVFSWLYDETKKNKYLGRVYNRESVKEKYYINGVVNTPYGRTIKTTPAKALSYIIQSTSNDIFLTQAFKINSLLSNKGSYISILMHDSLIIDLSLEDREMIKELKDTFSDTDFGKFRVNLKIGKNYGDMVKKE
jgi:hypothetical protein